MKILILGGTAFLGPEVVAAARARGDELTLFNRGRTNPELFKDAEGVTQLHGDRDPKKGDGLRALEEAIAAGRRWDAVIDTSGYVPRIVEASALLLKPAVRQYIFVSTVSVYRSFTPGMDESGPLGTIEDPTTEKVTGESYGPLKALCEQAALKVFGDACANIRPGLIVGPGDPTDRFTYWPVRVDRGGRVLVPQAPKPREAFVSFIDGRDLAEWLVTLAHDGHGGTFNATGPAGPLTFDEMVIGCKASTSAVVELVPIPEAWLLERGVRPWMEMPLWVPQGAGDEGSMGSISRAKAIERGLTFRPLAQTAMDTIAWWKKTRPADADFGAKGAGMARAREAELLEAFAKS